MRYILSFALIFTGLAFSFSQNKTDTYWKEKLNQLSSGKLVVRVMTQGKKITVLSEMLLNPGISKTKKDLIQKDIDRCRQQDSMHYKYLLDACKQELKFCTPVFVPDSLFQAFREGKNEVFLDTSGRIISIEGVNFRSYVALISERDPERLRLVDHQLLPIGGPFPYKAIIWYTYTFGNMPKYYSKQIKYFEKKLSKLSARS